MFLKPKSRGHIWPYCGKFSPKPNDLLKPKEGPWTPSVQHAINQYKYHTVWLQVDSSVESLCSSSPTLLIQLTQCSPQSSLLSPLSLFLLSPHPPRLTGANATLVLSSADRASKILKPQSCPPFWASWVSPLVALVSQLAWPAPLSPWVFYREKNQKSALTNALLYFPKIGHRCRWQLLHCPTSVLPEQQLQ